MGEDDLFQVDLVNRYIDLTKKYRQARNMANKQDGSSTIINGSQEYEKESVYHKQMRDYNKEMLAIQRLLKLDGKNIEYDESELT